MITKLKQWAVSRIEYDDQGKIRKGSKRPLQIDGRPASTTNPSTWTSYQNARSAVQIGIGTHKGFVFTPLDDLCVWDLDYSPDDKKRKFVNKLVNIAWKKGHYVEKSLSGNGWHIVYIGKQMANRRRANVEFYSKDRYMILTMNSPRRSLMQDDGWFESLHSRLFPESTPRTAVVDAPQTKSDTTVLTAFFESANGGRNTALYRHEIAGDQSQLDAMLLERLCFFSPNDDQVKRLFYGSIRGKRIKVIQRGDEYVDRGLRFAREKHAAASKANQAMRDHYYD